QLLVYIPLIVFYLLVTIILLKKSQSLTRIIIQQTQIDAGIKFDQSRNNLLYALFIGLGMYQLLVSLPAFLKNIFQYFTDKVGRHGMLNLLDKESRPDSTPQIIGILLAVIIILFAKQLANYFSNYAPYMDEEAELGSEQNQPGD